MLEPDAKSRPGLSLRPRDAATLILYRHRASGIEVLMGERHGSHAFMPNRYVFPGGAVDRDDHRVRCAGALRNDVSARLCRAATPARARALAIAAIRETYEETGLMLGEPDPAPDKPAPKGWEAFFGHGLAPAIGRLDYVARAITPPQRPRRFNARFFMAEADGLSGDIRENGELLDLHWVNVDDARSLEIPLITGIVLGHVKELALAPPPADPTRPVPRYRILYGRRDIGTD